MFASTSVYNRKPNTLLLTYKIGNYAVQPFYIIPQFRWIRSINLFIVARSPSMNIFWSYYEQQRLWPKADLFEFVYLLCLCMCVCVSFVFVYLFEFKLLTSNSEHQTTYKVQIFLQKFVNLFLVS